MILHYQNSVGANITADQIISLLNWCAHGIGRKFEDLHVVVWIDTRSAHIAPVEVKYETCNWEYDHPGTNETEIIENRLRISINPNQSCKIGVNQASLKNKVPKSKLDWREYFIFEVSRQLHFLLEKTIRSITKVPRHHFYRTNKHGLERLAEFRLDPKALARNDCKQQVFLEDHLDASQITGKEDEVATELIFDTVVLNMGFAEDEKLGQIAFRSERKFASGLETLSSLGAFLMVGWLGWERATIERRERCDCCGLTQNVLPDFEQFEVALYELPNLTSDQIARWIPYGAQWRIIGCAELMHMPENTIIVENAEKILSRLPTSRDLLAWANVHASNLAEFERFLDQEDVDDYWRSNAVADYASVYGAEEDDED